MVQYVSFYNCNRYSCFRNNATDFSEIAYLTNPGHSFFPIFQGVLCYLFTMLLKQLPSKMRDPIQFSWLGSWILFIFAPVSRGQHWLGLLSRSSHLDTGIRLGSAGGRGPFLPLSAGELRFLLRILFALWEQQFQSHRSMIYNYSLARRKKNIKDPDIQWNWINTATDSKNSPNSQGNWIFIDTLPSCQSGPCH